MGRIVINKHYNDSSLITPDKFKNEGEIAISNEYGFEGIYIINTNGDVVKIGYGGTPSYSGSTSGTPSGELVDKVFLKDYLRSQAYMTSAQTEAYVAALEEAMMIFTSAFTEHKAENVADFASLSERIDALSGMSAEVVIDEELVREITSEEIAKIVDSADTRFDTLKEIADWIINDGTGAAEMASDIQSLKNSVSALTADVDDIKGDSRILEALVLSNKDNIGAVSANTVENRESIEELGSDIEEINEGVSAITEEVNSLREYVDSRSADTRTMEAIRQYIDQHIRNISIHGDHVFLSRAEYNELVATGRADISGETFYYSDEIYYCLYDDGNEYTGSTGGSIVYVLSGDIMDIQNVVVDDNGFIELNAPITEDGFIDIDAAVQPIPSDEEIEIDDEGVVESGYQTTENSEGLFIEMPSGTQWI